MARGDALADPLADFGVLVEERVVWCYGLGGGASEVWRDVVLELVWVDAQQPGDRLARLVGSHCVKKVRRLL